MWGDIIIKLKIDSEEITPLFESYNEFVEEAVIKITQKGLESIACDKALVCVFSLSIPKEKFEHFEVEKEEKLGINLANFVDILKRAGKEKITLEYEEHKRLTIKINSRTFTMALLDITEEEIPPIEQLEFKSSFKIKSKILTTAINDGKLNSDTVWFETDNSTLKLHSEGDIAHNETILDKYNENLLNLKGTAKAQYPIDYLEKLRLDKFSDEVLIEFSEQAPCKINFLGGFLILAPRVVEEEEKSEEVKEVPKKKVDEEEEEEE